MRARSGRALRYVDKDVRRTARVTRKRDRLNADATVASDLRAVGADAYVSILEQWLRASLFLARWISCQSREYRAANEYNGNRHRDERRLVVRSLDHCRSRPAVARTTGTGQRPSRWRKSRYASERSRCRIEPPQTHFGIQQGGRLAVLRLGGEPPPSQHSGVKRYRWSCSAVSHRSRRRRGGGANPRRLRWETAEQDKASGDRRNRRFRLLRKDHITGARPLHPVCPGPRSRGHPEVAAWRNTESRVFRQAFQLG